MDVDVNSKLFNLSGAMFATSSRRLFQEEREAEKDVEPDKVRFIDTGIEIGLFEFKEAKQNWGVVNFVEGRAEQELVLDKLKLLTYNVWFDKSNREERFMEVLSLLEKESPHVVCLQEICYDVLRILLQSELLRTNYFITNPETVTKEDWYGTITLIQKGVPVSASAKYFSYQKSFFDRAVTIITLPPGLRIGNHVTKHSISIGNTHLDSPVKGVTPQDRKDQLLSAVEVLSLSETHVLAGDFNFISEAETGALQEVNLVDTWRDLRGAEEGYTYDAQTNKNIADEYQSRPDMITYAKSGELLATAIRMVGRENIPGIQVPPSDHYGLQVDFTISTYDFVIST
eukprot:m.295143 g.295143  ORF g.295143 m.295143 type:complete len:343 (-) comp16393_c6_seq2:1131-2159(-)